MSAEMPASKAPWKIPYFHHPLFNAGPKHAPYRKELDHWLGLFERTGVKVAFSGHEHNFQFSEAGPATRGIRFVISGAGGELRSGTVTGAMAEAHMEGWAAQNHFLVVEIEGKTMRITPVSSGAMVVHGRDGGAVGMPLVVRLP